MRRLVTTHLALQAYRLENGRAPATLAELTPDYLPAVPQDPYGTGPLIYRREPDNETWQLYSIGPDREDNGGQRLTPALLIVANTGDLFVESFFSDSAVPPAGFTSPGS